MTNKKIYFLLFLIVCLGLVLRLMNLGMEPYWGDEAMSLDIVQHYQNNIPGLLVYLKTIEVHPPLYYLLLNGWARIFGWQEFGVRLLSLVFGLGVILLAYWLYQLLFQHKKMALLAAFFMAVLPFQVEFSQEARPYIIFCFMALLSAIFYWQYQKTNKIIFVGGYLTATILGLFLHYSFLFFAGALALFWLAAIFIWQPQASSKKIIIWLAAHAFIFMAYFFQLITLLYKAFLGKYPILGIERRLDWKRPVDFFGSVMDQLVWLTKNMPVSNVELLAVLIFKTCLVAAFIWLIGRNRASLAARLRHDKKPLAYVFWLTVAPVIFFFFSPYSTPYTPIFEKHVIASSVFIIIFLVYYLSLFDLKKTMLLGALFFLSVMNMLVVVVGDDSLWHDDFRIKSMADHINLNYRSGDIVIVADAIARSDLNHYLRPDISAISLYPLGLLDYHYDFLSSRQTLGLGENEAQLRYYSLSDKAQYTTEFDAKMNYLIKKYNPQRIWYLFQIDHSLEMWLDKKDWRLVMDSLGPLHPLKLYSQNNPDKTSQH